MRQRARAAISSLKSTIRWLGTLGIADAKRMRSVTSRREGKSGSHWPRIVAKPHLQLTDAPSARALKRKDEAQQQAVRHDRAEGRDHPVHEARHDQALSALECAPPRLRRIVGIGAWHDLEQPRMADPAAL